MILASIGYAPADGARSEIGQRQRVVSMPRAKPVKGAPNVVGTPAIVGIPLWVVAHVAVLGAADTDGVEGGVMPLRGVSELVTGADGFGLRATDGGLRPPPPSSVEPSGIPTMPTDEPGPMDEAKGGDAAAQGPGALALIPPPSKSAVLDNPVIELAVPADAPVVKPPMPADSPVITGLPMAADAGADEAPAHVAPTTGAAPEVVGLTPGVASSVAPRGIPVCPTGALGMPSGDVMPSAGRGETFMLACALAEPQPKRTAAVAIANRVIMGSTFSSWHSW
jgi:hypothetical protein